MPTVSCGKECCKHNYTRRCTLKYIYMQAEKSGPHIRCEAFEMDPEYERAFELVARNPQLSREKQCDRTEQRGESNDPDYY